MSANNKVILECEDRSTLMFIMIVVTFLAANPLIFKIVIMNTKMIVHLGSPINVIHYIDASENIIINDQNDQHTS